MMRNRPDDVGRTTTVVQRHVLNRVIEGVACLCLICHEYHGDTGRIRLIEMSDDGRRSIGVQGIVPRKPAIGVVARPVTGVPDETAAIHVAEVAPQ